MTVCRVDDGESSDDRCSMSGRPAGDKAGAGHLCAGQNSPHKLDFRAQCSLRYVFLAQTLKNANIHNVECEKANFSSQLMGYSTNDIYTPFILSTGEGFHFNPVSGKGDQRICMLCIYLHTHKG